MTESKAVRLFRGFRVEPHSMSAARGMCSYVLMQSCGFVSPRLGKRTGVFRQPLVYVLSCSRSVHAEFTLCQVAIHVFCLVSSVVRLGYIICEASDRLCESGGGGGGEVSLKAQREWLKESCVNSLRQFGWD